MSFVSRMTAMRATASRPPIRARQRLLQGCAIAAAMTALAHGGSALAQVAGTGEFAIGSGTISPPGPLGRSEEHTSELQSLMRISYAVFCLKKQKEKSSYTIVTHKLIH